MKFRERAASLAACCGRHHAISARFWPAQTTPLPRRTGKTILTAEGTLPRGRDRVAPAPACGPFPFERSLPFFMAIAELLPTHSDIVIARIESAPFGENTYVLSRRGTPECLVFDPGFEPDAVIDWIEAHGLTPVAILLTHGHSDHIAGNAALRERWPALPILIGRDDAAGNRGNRYADEASSAGDHPIHDAFLESAPMTFMVTSRRLYTIVCSNAEPGFGGRLLPRAGIDPMMSRA